MMIPDTDSMAIDQHQLREYQQTLDEIQLLLSRFGVREWPERLVSWISELNAMAATAHPDALTAHIVRSQRATGGMGSIGDIFISPQAGDTIPDENKAIDSANKELKRLVSLLYRQTMVLLGQDVRQP